MKFFDDLVGQLSEKGFFIYSIYQKIEHYGQ